MASLLPDRPQDLCTCSPCHPDSFPALLSAASDHKSAPGPQVTSAEEPSLIYSHSHDLAPRGLLSQIVTAGALLPCFGSSVCAWPGL